MATLPYWNNDEVISSDKLNSMVQAIINGDPLAVKVSNATKNDVNQIVGYLSSLHDNAKTNLNSATSTSAFDTAYTNMTALVSNKLGSYANDDTVDLYSTGIRASIIAFLQAYDNMISNDRLNNKNTDNTLGSRIDSEATDRRTADEALDTKIFKIQIGGQNLLKDTDKMTNTNYWQLRGAQSVRAEYGGKHANEVGIALSNYNVQGNSSNPYIDYIPQVSFEQGTDYTVSFWTTVVDAPVLYLNANDNADHHHNSSQQNIPLQASGRVYGDWKQVTATFKPTVATAYLTFVVSTAWVSSFKLEKGNKATDWQPALDDTNSAIERANKTANDNSTLIWQGINNGGGRNLLKGTRDFSGVSIQGSKVAVTNGQDKFQAAYGTQNSSQTYFDLLTFAGVPLEKDTDYTASFWVKTSENTEIWSFLYDSGSNGNYADGATKNYSTTDYTRVVVHFHNGNNNATPNFIPVRINKKSTITVWVYGCMLEKGKVAHDWQPAPEDTRSQIDNLNANKISSSDVNWNLVVKNSSNTYSYASGSTITLPHNSSITLKDDRVIPRINLPIYFTDYFPNAVSFHNLATMGECDNLFISSATMATLANRPTNPDTNASLTGDCFFTNRYAYSGTTVRAFQKIYSCDYNYIFIRSWNSSSASWTNWSCLTPYA